MPQRSNYYNGRHNQALGLISRLLISPKNREVILEDPITRDIQKIISDNGGKINPVPVDSMGIKTERLPKKISPGAIFVTPSHHYPLGVTMSAKRRVELLNYIKNRDIYIIEDDYDSELRYDVNPTPALQGLNPERVIYMGTFSKTLCPALRIGYIVLPYKLIERARYCKWNSDLHNSVIDQLILAKFINEGHYSHHISQMKKKQKNKREFLINNLKTEFKGKVKIIGSAVGLHIAVKFKNINFNKSKLQELEQHGVRVYPVEEHSMIKGNYRDTVIIGFGFLTQDQIEKGIHILKWTLTL